MSHKSFLERLQAGEVLIADGSTGATLMKRGLPRGQSPEHWVLEQPDQILRLHKDFITAGSDIILTSTFGGTSLRLVGSSIEGHAVEVSQRAAALARQAVEGTSVLVAGSLGPVGQLIKPYGPLTEEQVLASYTEQAKALNDGGIDFLVIETQFDLVEAKAAIQGARSVSSLPLVCSFSYDRGKRTMMGVSPTKSAQELAALGIDCIGINCGRSLEENLANLKELRQVTKLPIWFKPNAGLPKIDINENTYFDTTPEAMGAAALEWVASGAQVIGGCCGTSPEHLGQIAQAVKAAQTE
jgi:5-methyltetrahydrofolate--homocysteine methyltransferase